jgi:hypothetical protein
MTQDITADLRGSPRLVIAFMDEHDQFAHVCEAAMGLAKRSGARTVFYDRDAWGWLPAEHGTNHAVDYARRHGADVVLLPAELDQPGRVDRLRRQTVDRALQTAESATDPPAILLVDRNGQIRPAGRPLRGQSEPRRGP